MPARRMKSLHHALGEKNVVFHREHRSKRGRKIRKQTDYNMTPYNGRNTKQGKRWLNDAYGPWKPKK